MAVTCATTTSTSSTATSSSSCTDAATGITITITPATASVNVVSTFQFSAAVSNGTNTVLTWQVNGIAKGNSSVGLIDAAGLYTAPTTVPSGGTVNVVAVSFEDPALSATATVTITPAPTVAITSPTTAVTVASGTSNTVPFSATETGGTINKILWQVGPVGGLGILGGNAIFGTISASGVYSAPVTPPVGQTVVVTAVAQDYPTSTAAKTVTISGYSTSSLQGRFAFSMSGRILSGASAGAFYRAGSFSADGAGNLNGGLEDINEASGVTPALSFVGTYTVASDGRGTLKFSDSHLPAGLPSIFDFVLVNGSQLQITGFDSSATATYPGTATGQATLQDSSAFTNLSLSALSGTYVFDFAGMHGSNALSEIGEFTADGAGNITGGSIDINDGGASTSFQITGNTAPVGSPASFPSTYSISSTGRGTAVLATNDPAFPTLTFSFYVISKGLAAFVGTGTVQAVAGSSMLQSPNGPFNLAALNGRYAFLLAGSHSGGSIATAGSFLANGAGAISSGALDENVGGAPNSGISVSNGTYTVAASGRGTATFTASSRAAGLSTIYALVFYLGPSGSAVFQETDSSITSDGLFTIQQSAAFTQASFQGSYAINASGSSGTSAQAITGQLVTTGAGTVASGALDINTAGTLTPGEAVTGSYATPAANGRVTLALNPSTDNRNFAAYIVNSSQVFVLGIDTGRIAVGALNRRF